MSDNHPFAVLAENRGIWVYERDDSATDYRTNGHDSTLKNPGRCNRYRKPRSILATLKAKNKGEGVNPSSSLQAIDKLSPAHVERYYFDFIAEYIKGKRIGQSLPNFSRGGTPYGNQAHHLIPQGQFLSLFKTREANMLKRIDYNVHNGKNIIFLPAFATDCGYHNLPYHMGPHPEYDKRVESEAIDLARDLKELSEDACSTEGLADIKAQLFDIQDDLWSLLSQSGPVAVSSIGLE